MAQASPNAVGTEDDKAGPAAASATGLAAAGDAAEQSLYEIRRKIYPRAVSGWFAGWRWALVGLTQLVFYGAAWLEWNGRQAVLFDLVHRKFYVLGFVFWPQDFVYLAVLLIISALALFLFTAVAGRLWCGYACPQTVYTEIFLWVERKVEGGRAARIKLDQGPLAGRKVGLKAAKHAVWIAISLWTGFTFVGYFSPIRALWSDVLAGATGAWETFWILFYGFATYGNAGWMREQVCTYMCPYARFQSAMFDPDTLIITYDPERGEPRGGRLKSAHPGSLGLGDCVDCGVCVQVCPTGIDIRSGLQYECIGCAACIDGCNRVMDRFGYSRGLIRYATARALESRLSRGQMFARALRPRILVYAAILLAIIVAAGASLALRVPLKVDVIRDRGSISREIEGGLIENVYRLQIMNTAERVRRFTVRGDGLPTLFVAAGDRTELAGATTQMLPVSVRVQASKVGAGSHRIRFIIVANDDPHVAVQEKSVFVVRQQDQRERSNECRAPSGGCLVP